MTAYHQICFDPSDARNTAIATPFVLFEFVRMLYGMKNAAQNFQRLIDEVTRGLPFIFVYLDDILVGIHTDEERREHLRLLFERLDEPGLVLIPKKCILGVEALAFLGHRISPQGIKLLESRVRPIEHIHSAASLRKLRELPGLINSHRSFITSCAQVHQLLTDLPRRDSKTASFQEAKTRLATVALLIHPLPAMPTRLMVDVSTTAVGAVLQQHGGIN